MFTPEELEKLSKAFDNRMKDLENSIMYDIVMRIKKNSEITRAADWKIYRLSELGKSSEFITNGIKSYCNISEEEIENLYNDVITKGFAHDEDIYKKIGKSAVALKNNLVLQQLVTAMAVQTSKEMINLSQSLGFAVKMGDKITFTPLATYYQKSLDNAVNGIISGAFDYNTAIKKAVGEMTNSGLRTVDYASGHSNRIEVAARRAVMTGFNQIVSKINEQNAEKLNTEMFEVTYHIGARPTHALWQGRWYKKSELHSVCGLGDVKGLCGANCYHNYFPVIPGISKPTYTEEELQKMYQKENTPVEYNGKQYTAYEATQRQRKLETNMRAERQKIKLLQVSGSDEESIMLARGRYRATSQEYTAFSKAMNLPEQRQRVTVDGLGNIGNCKYTKIVANSKNSGIINTGAISGALNPYSKEAEKHAIKYYEAVRHMKTDTIKISKVTGISQDKIDKIKNHVFITEHDLINGKRRFDPDYEMAQSWQRLISGNFKEQDIILLKHEYAELRYMEKGFSQNQAHIKASRRYDFAKYCE